LMFGIHLAVALSRRFGLAVPLAVNGDYRMSTYDYRACCRLARESRGVICGQERI
jgi:hypothetical protein